MSAQRTRYAQSDGLRGPETHRLKIKITTRRQKNIAADTKTARHCPQFVPDGSWGCPGTCIAVGRSAGTVFVVGHVHHLMVEGGWSTSDRPGSVAGWTHFGEHVRTFTSGVPTAAACCHQSPWYQRRSIGLNLAVGRGHPCKYMHEEANPLHRWRSPRMLCDGHGRGRGRVVRVRRLGSAARHGPRHLGGHGRNVAGQRRCTGGERASTF